MTMAPRLIYRSSERKATPEFDVYIGLFSAYYAVNKGIILRKSKLFSAIYAVIRTDILRNDWTFVSETQIDPLKSKRKIQIEIPLF